MNKFFVTILLGFFPILAFSQGSSLSFAPPASDYSVVFLGNLFGVVDGVLHGTGSQIMGNMFGVFNSAVLALGGIIIMYTLIVSTMNTAHEGQVLGQKWSSIWIPVRSTLGLALLIPKASGYCLMQIFVMWIVVQGVGAADKVWEAALSYLNRGGVIIKAQQQNLVNELTNNRPSEVAVGALNILGGQVCMLGLEKQLQAQRQVYINAKQNNSGPCSGTPSAAMNTFCNSSIPDFLGTVNAVIYQNNNRSASTFSLPMPNFDRGSPFSFLNGICGSIHWNSIAPLSQYSPGGAGSSTAIGSNNQAPAAAGQSGSGNEGSSITLSSNELQTAQLSRAIAIQQMYLDLSTVAQTMVNNDPQINSNGNNTNNPSTPPYSLVATQQFGVPYTKAGTTCSDYSLTCVIWGPLSSGSGSTAGVLFNGTEFLGAINDYNGIMAPTLNLIKQANDKNNDNDARKFINDATTKGWILAGSYFFDLVRLNGNAVKGGDKTDTGTGLENSTFDPSNLLSAFGQGGCTQRYYPLCEWFGQDSSRLTQVESLIDGTVLTTQNGVPVTGNAVPKPDLAPNPTRPFVGGLQSSTVYGFVNNSVMIQLPGQPGLKPLKFANIIHFNVDTKLYYLERQKFDCGRVKIVVFSFCLGRMMGDFLYNYTFRYVYNAMLQIFGQLINQVVFAFLMLPIQGMSEIFQNGLKTVSNPGTNPIVALANMGVLYINFSGDLWLRLLNLAVVSALIPWFGVFIFALISLALPLLLAWIGIMVGIGFITAYYIPILPYMIFTFGSLAWLMVVIEAMVAAPIVALGVTHPEGHDAFGKGEHAIMILLNVFLRPAMMIIGYISAIALSYVGVWILNAGFDQAIGFIQTGSDQKHYFKVETPFTPSGGGGSGTGGYASWAGIYAFFFSILIYTSMYLIIVQKAFTMITVLPDRVLRWIGGAPESSGVEQWGEELKQGAIKEGGAKTQDAQGQIDKQLGGYGQKAVLGAKELGGKALGGGGSVDFQGGDSTPKGPV